MNIVEHEGEISVDDRPVVKPTRELWQLCKEIDNTSPREVFKLMVGLGAEVVRILKKEGREEIVLRKTEEGKIQIFGNKKGEDTSLKENTLSSGRN
jgi:hypothetical protein